MIPSRTTRILLAIAAVLALLLALPRGGDDTGGPLPALPAIDRDGVTRIRFERAGQAILIERQGEVWRLLQPLQAEADAGSLEALLQIFGEPVPIDARVDVGHLESYGLDDNEGVRFEVFTGGAEPALALVVGLDVEGGSTLLRLSGSDDVYRARLGGAYRFRKDAPAWRNRSVLALDPARMAGLTIEGAGGALTFLRDPTAAVGEGEAPTQPTWRLQDDSSFPLDQPTLDALARSLARLRASEVHASDFGSGWDRPAGAYEVALADGTTHRILVVSDDGAASGLARVDDRPDVYRIAGSWVGRLEQGREAYRDRTLFAFAPDQVESLVLEEGTARVRIRRDPTTGTWRAVEPISAEVDLRTALAAVRTLGGLRAHAVAEGADSRNSGLNPPRARLQALLADGSSQSLEVGTRFQEGGQEWVRVRRAGRDTIWVLPAETWKRMRAAFVRG